MLFLLWHPHTFCRARHSGCLLALDAGSRGMSLLELSELCNYARLIGMTL